MILVSFLKTSSLTTSSFLLFFSAVLRAVLHLGCLVRCFSLGFCSDSRHWTEPQWSSAPASRLRKQSLTGLSGLRLASVTNYWGVVWEQSQWLYSYTTLWLALLLAYFIQLCTFGTQIQKENGQGNRYGILKSSMWKCKTHPPKKGYITELYFFKKKKCKRIISAPSTFFVPLVFADLLLFCQAAIPWLCCRAKRLKRPETEGANLSGAALPNKRRHRCFCGFFPLF